MCLSDNIRYLRIKKGLSQEYVANALGYKSFTTIQKWESGVSEPPVKKLKELAALLGADMDDMTTMDLSVEQPDSKSSYYLDDESKEAAQFLYYNPEYKVLFDATRRVKKEDIDFVKQMLDRFKSE